MAILETIYETKVNGAVTTMTPIGQREVPAEDEVHGAPKAVIEPDADGDGLVVWPDWSNVVDVDRPRGVGVGVGPGTKGKKLAERLVRAIEDGAVHYDTYVRKDIYGQTYVAASSRVWGKYLNADLKRLGY